MRAINVERGSSTELRLADERYIRECLDSVRHALKCERRAPVETSEAESTYLAWILGADLDAVLADLR